MIPVWIWLILLAVYLVGYAIFHVLTPEKSEGDKVKTPDDQTSKEKE